MGLIVKWSLRGLGALIALLALVVMIAWLWLESSLPRTSGEVTVTGLAAPVRVLRDADGMITLRADSLRDAYAALGYVHAQDRLWQMDMMRRLGAGRVSEILGEFTIRHDRFIRTLGFEALARAQFKAISPETRADIEAYTRGVNAFLENRAGALPPEFLLLRYEPQPWEPYQSLLWGKLMALQLSGNYEDEILRARLLQKLRPEQVAFLWPDYENDTPIVDAGHLRALMDIDLDGMTRGVPWALRSKSASNSWVVDGRQTESGLPILANDPHLGLNSPGTWYFARIETPELTIVGATAPGIPYHLIGHNGKAAWGFTTTHSDTQDLFIERVTDSATAYETPEGPRPFDVRMEEIQVQGEANPRRVEVRATRHGPVISDTLRDAQALSEEGGAKVLSLAWPALRNDDRTPDAMRAINHSRSFGDLVAAVDRFHAPHQNILFADTTGVIGMVAPSRVPVRRNSDGSVPVPGWTGDYDWNGFVPYEDLPAIRDPAGGRIVNANNKLVGKSYPYVLNAHWPPPTRARRIEELLDRIAHPYRLDDMTAMQMDAHSGQAVDLLPTVLPKIGKPVTEPQTTALRLLADWDHVMSRDRPEPLIYMSFLRELHRRLFADELEEAFNAYLEPNPVVIGAAFERQPSWCNDVTTPDTENCSEIASAAFRSALEGLQAAHGDDPTSWRWGEAHRATFPHPVIDRLPVLGPLFNFAVATDGGVETVNRGSVPWIGPDPYQHRHGPSMRVVFDLVDLDNSRFQIATGQSGNPLSQNYGSFAKRWRDGVFVKLVGDATEDEQRLTLNPR